jgi:Bacterial SH3 domain
VGAKNSKGVPATPSFRIVQYWTAIYLGLADHQFGKEGNMAHIIYDNDQPGHYNSTGYHGSSNSGYALLAVVILFVLFFWADLGGLRATLGSWPRGNTNSRVMPVEGPIINPITDIRYVIADNLNMREQPGSNAQVGYILPRGTKVALLGESHQEFDGDLWLKVRVETFEGPYVGWVNHQYVE